MLLWSVHHELQSFPQDGKVESHTAMMRIQAPMVPYNAPLHAFVDSIQPDVYSKAGTVVGSQWTEQL